MTSWRTQALQGLKTPVCSKLVCSLFVLLSVLAFSGIARPQAGIRESRRSADEYDRTINRMKNDAKASKERRINLFPQINEDFQRIQVIHNEIVRMLQPEKTLNYDRLVDLTDDMKERSARLRENLALPESEKTEERPARSEVIDDTQMKKAIGELHDLVVSFVSNPLFKNLGVVDARAIDLASDNLNQIIDVSDKIKKGAKVLSRSPKK